MKNKFIIVLMLGIFLISFASATLPPVKNGECIQLRTISNASAVTLSTLTYPNQTTLFLDTPMTKNGQTFNYTFCDTLSNGRYIYDYYDSDGNTFVNDFLSTPTGFEEKSFWENSLLLIFVLLAIFFLIFGFSKESGIFIFISSILFLVVGVYTMIYGFNDITNMYTRAVSVVLIGVGFIYMMWSAYDMIIH